MERRWSVPIISTLSALLVVVLVAPGLEPAAGAIPTNGTYSACLTKATGRSRSSMPPSRSATRASGSSSGTPRVRLVPRERREPRARRDLRVPLARLTGTPSPTSRRASPTGSTTSATSARPIPRCTASLASATSGSGPRPLSARMSNSPLSPWAQTQNVEVVQELFESGGSGVLRHYYRVVTYGTGAVDFKVRSRVYNTGIAPAALKKVAKSIKVRVTDRGPLKSRR